MTTSQPAPSAEQISDLFDQADQLLFKDRKYSEAEQIYKNILEADPSNVDAINSMAYCVKFMAAANSQALPGNLFENLKSLYLKALSFKPTDVEANFNLGLLYLQFNQDLGLALDCFTKCVEMNKSGSETAKLFTA